MGGKAKKMWSAALSSSKGAPEAERDLSQWMAKASHMSVFDLRKPGIEWQEEEDFSDEVWKEGLGKRNVQHYLTQAIPLTLVAATALAEVDVPSALMLHVLNDANAPVPTPHDWDGFLKRMPAVTALTVVYIDHGPHQPGLPVGELLTVNVDLGIKAKLVLFNGTYKEFLLQCHQFPLLARPHLVFWSDMSLYGTGDKEFSERLEAFKAIKVPSVITLRAEVVRGSTNVRIDDCSSQSMAIVALGLEARELCGWHWNRFIVPRHPGAQGIVASHGLVAVVQPGEVPSVEVIKKKLEDRGIRLAPLLPPEGVKAAVRPPPEQPAQQA